MSNSLLFCTSHGVEEELGGGEPGVEAVSDETLGVWYHTIPREMREGPGLKAIRSPLTVDSLLSDTRDHLKS